MTTKPSLSYETVDAMTTITTKPSLSYETVDTMVMDILKKYKLENLESCGYSHIYDAIFEAVEKGFDKAVNRYLEKTIKMFGE